MTDFLEFDDIGDLPFDDIDCSEELLCDVESELELSELYDSIERDVEDSDDEEIAQRVLTGLLEDAAARLTDSHSNPSSPSIPFPSNDTKNSPTSSNLSLVPTLMPTSAMTRTFPTIPQQLSPTLSWKLGQLEDLLERYMYRFDDVRDVIKYTDGDFMVNFFGNMGEAPWKNSVQFMKSLDGFSHLCEDDQVVLVRSVQSEFGTLANLMMSDPEGKRFIFEDRKKQKVLIEIDFIFKMIGMGTNEITRVHQDRFERVMQSCRPEWRLNPKLMLLLIGIALFNPDRQRLRDRCLVWKIQEFFYDLLRKYLAVLYPREADARLAFVGLIGFLAGVREVGKLSMKDFYEANIPFVRNWIDHHSTLFTRELLGITEC